MQPRLQAAQVSGVAETSALLAWLLTQECISDTMTIYSFRTTVVQQSSCQLPKVVAAIVVVPEPKPVVIKTKPKAKATRKRSSACGSRRQVWRTLPNGHRKYRCKR